MGVISVRMAWAAMRHRFVSAVRDSACRSVRATRREAVYVRRIHIEHAAVIVDDYDSAISFYVHALGFELVENSASLTNAGRAKRWVVVRPPGAATGLLLARADGARERAAVGSQFAGRVGLFLRAGDFDACCRRMLAHGVEFVTEPWRHIAVFVDVAGNKWDLLGT